MRAAAVFALCVATVFSGLLAVPALSQKGGEEETGPYTVVENWLQPFARPGYVQGAQSGVFAETPDRIFLLNRGELKLPDKLPSNFNGAWGSIGEATAAKAEIRNCIVVVDGNGRMRESWAHHDRLFAGGRCPHHIRISPYDPARHVWVVDDRRQQIFKFSNDGSRLVMALGEAGVAGSDDKHFDLPTDIAWLPDGTFFVSDGYRNSRVVKFDKDGRYLMAWGEKGRGRGQFNLPHAIETDKNRRVYVADRSNERIQIFDEHGKYLDEWPNIRHANYIMITADQHLWAADGVTDKFLQYDLNGKLLSSWGTHGIFPGAVWGVHQFSVDSEGNLYAAEAWGGRTQKFRPAPGADRSKLIGAPIPLMPKARE